MLYQQGAGAEPVSTWWYAPRSPACPEDRRGGPSQRELNEQQYRDNEALNEDLFLPKRTPAHEDFDRATRDLPFDRMQKHIYESYPPRSLDD